MFSIPYTSPERPRKKCVSSPCMANERRLPKPPRYQHWALKHLIAYAKEALVNIDICRIREANRKIDNEEIWYTSPTH